MNSVSDPSKKIPSFEKEGLGEILNKLNLPHYSK